MFYSFLRVIMKICFAILYRVKVTGIENFPKEGGVVLCGNHIHLFDPVVLACVVKRKLHFMAKKEAFDNKALGFVLNKIGMIKLNRQGTDLTAYKTALSYLKNQEAVGIFIQGTRMSELDLNSAKQGSAMFALKSDACIVPVHIGSTYKLFSKIVISFGAPLYLEEYKGCKINSSVLNEITDNVVKKIISMQVN